MAVENIQFFDLSRQVRALRRELNDALSGILDSAQFIMGTRVVELEEKIAALVGSPNAVALASGTDALLLSLRALGVTRGDAVITTPFTFFSTASTVARAGGRPLFVDIDPKTFNISMDKVEELLEGECPINGQGISTHSPTGCPVKGIIPVHLFGMMVDMKPFEAIAGKRNLFILEDAAQAIGAWEESGGKRHMSGSVGDAGIFSFYPTKNLGAYGDAGMMVTRRDEVAARVRVLRSHGSSGRDHFEEVGYLSRMDAFQAAVLLTKLPHLEEWNCRRRELAARYAEKIGSFGWAEKIGLPQVENDRNHTFHQFVIRVKERDRLADHLRGLGIGCEVYYSRPLHLQPAFASLGYREGDMPEAEKAARETLALPIWPELTDAEQDRVVDGLNSFFC